MGIQTWIPRASAVETAGQSAPVPEPPATPEPPAALTPEPAPPSSLGDAPRDEPPPWDEPPAWLAEVPPPDDEVTPGLNEDDLFVGGAAARGRQADGVASLDWPGLESRVAACEACELHRTRTQTVFGVGSHAADLMVIGEAPGADEDRQGEPFVGRAGQLLNAMLQAIGLERETVYIANVLKCRPPDNRDPRPEESRQCEPFLKRQVALVRPRVLLAVGRIAAQNLLQTSDPVGRLRGRPLSLDGVPLVVTYHPAYLLRSPEQKAKAWEDLQRVAELLRP